MGSRLSLESVPENAKWDVEEAGSIYGRQRRDSSTQVCYSKIACVLCDRPDLSPLSLDGASKLAEACFAILVLFDNARQIVAFGIVK